MNRKAAAILVLLFAVLMSLPWLVPHMGWLALVGFVPLLCLDRIARDFSEKKFFLWYWGAFILWNAATTFWVCNATVGGGIFAVLGNSFQMAVIWALFRFGKKKFEGIIPYIFLATAWIAWERFYFSAQISWPWLTLGNAFAGSISLVQWYEITGTLGGSLWIWTVNLGIFGIMTALSDGRWAGWKPVRKISAAAAAILVILGPTAASLIRYATFNPVPEGKVDVVIAQPDFDPYQKFQSLSQSEQNEVLLRLFDSAKTDSALLIAPETFTGDIFLNEFESGRTVTNLRAFLAEHPGNEILFGATTYDVFHQNSAPSILAREFGSGAWYESHNSAILLAQDREPDIFHKSKLVVGVESTPFPKLFVPLDNLLGGVMGRCIGQQEISLLNYRDSIPVGCAVCYESVFGEYCTGYVRKGAQLMTVITNDAWWGDTPGYRQHLRYSSLRAVELRRDIARCANTGISALISSRGDILESTGWWQEDILEGSVNLYSTLTPFARYGDVAGRGCTFTFLLLLALLIVRLLTRKD